jgi:hypothetical protein
MPNYHVNLSFDMLISDVEAFKAAVHPIIMRIGEQYGGLSGPGIDTTQQAADMVGQDLRMGVTALAMQALSDGIATTLPPGSAVENLKGSNEPFGDH